VTSSDCDLLARVSYLMATGVKARDQLRDQKTFWRQMFCFVKSWRLEQTSWIPPPPLLLFDCCDLPPPFCSLQRHLLSFCCFFFCLAVMTFDCNQHLVSSHSTSDRPIFRASADLCNWNTKKLLRPEGRRASSGHVSHSASISQCATSWPTSNKCQTSNSKNIFSENRHLGRHTHRA